MAEPTSSGMWAFVGAAVTVAVAWINARVRPKPAPVLPPALDPQAEIWKLYNEMRSMAEEARALAEAAADDLLECQRERAGLLSRLATAEAELAGLRGELNALKAKYLDKT